MSRVERKAMITRDAPELSLSRQCRLLSIGRSSFYDRPKGESLENLALMRRIDEMFLKYPRPCENSFGVGLGKECWPIFREFGSMCRSGDFRQPRARFVRLPGVFGLMVPRDRPFRRGLRRSGRGCRPG